MQNILLKPVSNICRTLRKPITCDVSDSIGAVLELFQEHKIGCVVVLDQEKIVGIFTERDYILKIAGNEEMILESFNISDYMTLNPQTLMLDSEVLLGMNYMRVGKYRHLVVVDEHKTLVNIISIKDFLDYLIDESEV